MGEHYCDERLLPGECIHCVRGFMPFIRVASWAGTTTTFVEILGRTPKRLRIRFLSDCPKGKRGDVKLVPIDVVQWPEVPRE